MPSVGGNYPPLATGAGSSKVIFVLGASDPEMARIEALLGECGRTVAKATVNGRRVAPSMAYRADGTDPAIPRGADVVCIECQVVGITPTAVIDHHRPGDPGYGKGPEDYWAASSIGQLYAMLPDATPAAEDRLIAAADHCLGHAYQGRCPGVDPDALRAWRTASRAAFQRCTKEEIEWQVDGAIATLQNLPTVMVAGQSVANAMFMSPIPEAPEASAITGIALMYSMVDRATGRMKVGLLGAEPATIREWMERNALEMGLVEVYGDPARGFAGAYCY